MKVITFFMIILNGFNWHLFFFYISFLVKQLLSKHQNILEPITLVRWVDNEYCTSMQDIFQTYNIYLSNIQSVSEDDGCGLFVHRIDEEFHINLWEWSTYGYCYTFPIQVYIIKLRVYTMKKTQTWLNCQIYFGKEYHYTLRLIRWLHTFNLRLQNSNGL